MNNMNNQPAGVVEEIKNGNEQQNVKVEMTADEIATKKLLDDEKFLVMKDNAHVIAWEAHKAKEDHLNRIKEQDIRDSAAEVERSRQEAVNSDISSLFNKRNERGVDQDTAKIKLVKSLLSLYKDSGAIENASKWSKFESAVQSQSLMIGNEKERAALLELANLGGNGALKALSLGQITEEQKLQSKQSFLKAGLSEDAANERVDGLVTSRKESIREAESILAKMGVDSYNI